MENTHTLLYNINFRFDNLYVFVYYVYYYIVHIIYNELFV